MNAAMLSLPLASLSLASLLLACRCSGDPPASLEACDDDDCRIAWLVAHWESDRARVLAEVEAMPSGPVRLASVQAIAEAHPGQAAELCDQLPEGSARNRCTNINARPHLWEIDLDDPTQGDQGSGKVFPTLTPTDQLSSPWDTLEPLAPECPADTHPRLCTTEQAWKAALEGRTQDAARLCLSIESDQWRYECFFESAERSFEPGKRGQVADALSLCLGAGPYLSRCLGHLSTAIARSAPAASSSDRAGWERLNRTAMDARRVLEAHDPGLAVRFTADTWARGLATSYSTAPAVTGNPLDVVEPLAVPHVRAAAAWRLLQLHGDQDLDLDTWVARLEDALHSRSDADQPPLTAPDDLRFLDHWTTVLDGEEALQWAPYLVGLRRALPADPHEDAMVCILEAAAQDGHKHPALFAQALDSDSTLVRWTAARLLRTEKPSRELKAKVSADPEPLVQARVPAWP